MDAGTAEELRWNTIDAMHSISGQVHTDSWWWLAVGTPHTGTTFEIFEAVGQALLVLVICVSLAERLPRVMYPLASVGRMPLTVYTGHILVLAVIVAFHPENAVGGPFYLEWFILGSFVFATSWRLLLGRGPLELGLGKVSEGAAVLMDEAGGRDRRG